MTDLEPRIDAYGTYARASALADFVELWALHRQPKSRSDVADYIDDNGWGSIVRETFVIPDDTSDSEWDDEDLGPDAEAAVDRVFTQIEARQAYLGSDYPFLFDNESGYLTPTDASPTPYLALLALTIAHAYRIDVGRSPPHDVFEDTVARALREAGHAAVNFSKIRGAFSVFAEALKNAGPALSLRTVPSGALVSKWAQDEGGDVIAQVHSGFSPSGGIGAWALVGQVTCAKSDKWTQKITEVKERAWGSWLDTQVPIQSFLAVPHQVETRHLEKLVSGDGRVVLDRLRLTAMLRTVSHAELSIFESIRSTPIASL